MSYSEKNLKGQDQWLMSFLKSVLCIILLGHALSKTKLINYKDFIYYNVTVGKSAQNSAFRSLRFQIYLKLASCPVLLSKMSGFAICCHPATIVSASLQWNSRIHIFQSYDRAKKVYTSDCRKFLALSPFTFLNKMSATR